MVHLGEVNDPATATPQVDLPLARHTIEVIGMLAAKTKGNLDADEERLLQTIQSELYSRYNARLGKS